MEWGLTDFSTRRWKAGSRGRNGRSGRKEWSTVKKVLGHGGQARGPGPVYSEGEERESRWRARTRARRREGGAERMSRVGGHRVTVIRPWNPEERMPSQARGDD